MAQQTAQKQNRKKEIDTSEIKAKDLKGEAKRIKDKADELVEKIDGVLEKNAEEFVKNYVQKGGE